MMGKKKEHAGILGGEITSAGQQERYQSWGTFLLTLISAILQQIPEE